MTCSEGDSVAWSTMKSPRCDSSSSPTGVSSEIGSCATRITRRIFWTGSSIFSASSSLVGSRPSSCTRVRERADQLVDGLDHVHGNADGARLIRDGARDRLPHPPRRISGELVTAAVFELLHRLHQSDIAFLNQIQELQPAIVVAFGDAHHQPEIRLDQFLARGLGLAVGAVHQFERAAQFGRGGTVLVFEFLHGRRQLALLAAQFPHGFRGADPAASIAR